MITHYIEKKLKEQEQKEISLDNVVQAMVVMLNLETEDQILNQRLQNYACLTILEYALNNHFM